MYPSPPIWKIWKSVSILFHSTPKEPMEHHRPLTALSQECAGENPPLRPLLLPVNSNPVRYVLSTSPVLLQQERCFLELRSCRPTATDQILYILHLNSLNFNIVLFIFFEIQL